jgi:hypothetical protein
MSRSLRRLFVLVAASALLAGCSSTAEKIGNCPAVTSLVETAVATVFRPNTPADPSNMLYTVEVTGTHASCDADKQANTSDTSLEIDFAATRAPNGSATHYKVPYFVAVTQADRILAKKIYTVEFDFAPGATTATFSDTVQSAEVTVGRDKKTFDYNIIVGLQLTKAQLDYNRTTNRYTP